MKYYDLYRGPFLSLTQAKILIGLGLPCAIVSDTFIYHSHFEIVIARVQQIAAEENENADKDGSIELGDNDVADEGIPDASHANDEEAKNEQIEGQEKEEDVGQGLAEDGSPLKLYDSEDDLFRWSQYKSDT